MKRWSFAAAIAALLLLGQSAWAQGILIVIDPPMPTPLPRPIIIHPPHPRPQPEPPASYRIKELSIQARLVDQVARVQVAQSFVNTGSRQMEVSFVFPLPYDGAVDQLTFLVDGKEYPARLLPAAEARQIYESYIRRNRDPALLEWVGTGMFKTSVFPVPPGAERTVNLRYNQLLRKDHAVTDFLVPLSTAKYTSQPVETLRIEASIESGSPIKNVYSPTHEVEVKRTDERHARVRYEARSVVPATDFRLFFDAAAGEIGASVISYRPEADQDGFFLLLASPHLASQDKTKDLPGKTAIFVVDRSGSMSGKKMDQAKEALRFVLNNLRPGDTFNIVAYDSGVESFRAELQRYDDKSRQAALGFVEGLYAGGSTNIDDAMTTALEMIQDSDRPSYVVFLTDGLPTAGETGEMAIVEHARRNNKHRARVISLGVGYDVNSRLLDRISRSNNGQSEFVRPDEDLEAHVSRLYNRISSPVMTDVEVEFDLEDARVADGPAVNRVYPRDAHDLFAGEQLVLVGRYRSPGAAKVVIRGQLGGKTRKFDFPVELAKRSGDGSYAFVEKLWAMRRIGEIIDEMDLKGKHDELVKELVDLSTRHGILTPYTSFLADDQPRANQLTWGAAAEGRVRDSLRRLDESAGRAAFAQRAEKNSLQQATRAPMSSGFGYGGARAGGAGALPADAAATAPAWGLPQYRDIDQDKQVAVESVQIVGNETLYRRGDRWFAANAQDVDVDRDADRIQTIERFSDDYFRLAAANTAAENSVLARQLAGQELIIRLRGQVYQIR